MAKVIWGRRNRNTPPSKISIWTPLMSDGEVLEKLNDFSVQDIEYLLRYQLQISKILQGKLRMLLEMLK